MDATLILLILLVLCLGGGGSRLVGPINNRPDVRPSFPKSRKRDKSIDE